MNLKLKQARKENGYSQADLADALNVDIKTVGNWERGKTLPDIEQLWKCAKVLHTRGQADGAGGRGGRADRLLPAEHREEALEDPGDGTRPGRAVPKSGCSA